MFMKYQSRLVGHEESEKDLAGDGSQGNKSSKAVMIASITKC